MTYVRSGLKEPPPDAECVLETARLLLSPMIATEAEALFELLKEPELYSFIGGLPPSSLDQLRAQLQRWELRRSPWENELWLNWTVRLKESGKIIGHVQSTVKTACAELAWVIGLRFQGKGYATEATAAVANWVKRRFELSELRANIHPQHAASQKVAKRIGLVRGLESTAQGEEVWVLRLR